MESKLSTPTSLNSQNLPEARIPSRSISDNSQPAARESLPGSTLPSTPQDVNHLSPNRQQSVHRAKHPCNTPEA